MGKHKLDEVIAFGEALIKTQDLDPVYVALVNVSNAGLWMEGQLARLLLAYFCFYHLGASAYISEYEGSEFWELMEQAAENQMPPSGTDKDIVVDRWPRGSERRHFRGSKCVDAVCKMREFSKDKPGPGAEHIITLWYEMAQAVTFTGFINTVLILPMFGNWIAFKAADVMERVLGAELEFPNDILTFYKEPRAALDLLDTQPELAAKKLLLHFRRTPAPPARSPRPRMCNIQEIESVCCKWKSSLSGHYYIGKDIHEVRHGLKGWGETAEKLLKGMPKEVQSGLFV